MRFTKPAWVIHREQGTKSEQNPKPLSIFSVHVHPDGSRIATGGLDAKVRIWSTKPILNESSELSGRPPKSLSTLSMHTGPVLVVRWGYSGRWLASGSDDTIVMIWDLDPTAKGKLWGSDEVNVEGWKPLKRLPGHESDVTDLAWAPGDRYLASVALDSKVLIWCGFTLERLHSLDLHRGFVKGVCWDPVGEFLATASDDRSVKIWRTSDWSLEAEVEKPFEASPGTFFRRLSWSPDGAHITASNATNNQGFVFIAAVIARNSWTSEISLVGHENTVEVSCYNPHIFVRNTSQPVVTSNICSVVALGGDDRSVSVWQTKSARPMIVAKEVFERQILDLSWSQDGFALYAVSSDGTMGVFHFDVEEMEGICPLSAQKEYLKKFGYEPPPLRQGFSHQEPPEAISEMKAETPANVNSVGQPSNGVNTLIAKRNKKRRVPLVGTMSAPAQPSKPQPPPTTISRLNPPSLSVGVTSYSFDDPVENQMPLDRLMSGSSSHSPTISSWNRNVRHPSDQFPSNEDVDMFDAHSDMSVHISALNDEETVNTRGKRKISDLIDDGRPVKARTLGGDQGRRERPVVREITSGSTVGQNLAQSSSSVLLPTPPLLNFLVAKVDGAQDVLECLNKVDEGLHELTLRTGAMQQTQWLDFLPSPAVAVTVTKRFCAAAMQDGSINVYTPTGRRMMPTMTLGSICAYLCSSCDFLTALTTSGMLHIWNVKKGRAHCPATSISPILGPNAEVISVTVSQNGAPIIHVSSGCAYSYDSELLAWVKLSEKWWAGGSSAWQARSRTGSVSANRGVVATIENAISEQTGPDDRADRERPNWWEAALTLGHLETRLQATKVLESPAEYKQALLVYAKRIAEDGFRGKAEELVKEMFGPLYWRPGRDDSWTPTLLGFHKRELLREVLNIFAKSKTLTKMALDWQDMLKKAMIDE